MAKRKSRNGGSSKGPIKNKKSNKSSKRGSSEGSTNNKRGKSLFNFNRDGQPFDLKPAKVGKYGGFSNLGIGGDLANPDFISDFYFGQKNMKKGSMKMSAFRNKNKHVGETASIGALDSDDEYELEKRTLPLRKRPVAFVRAKEVYDPSKELIELLRKRNNAENNYKGTKEQDPEPENAIEIEDSDEDVPDYDEVYGKDNEDNGSESDGYESGEEDIYNYEEDVLQNGQSADEDMVDETKENEAPLFYIDEEGDEVDYENIKVVTVSETFKPKNTEFNNVLTIGKVQLTVEQGTDDENVYSVPIQKKIPKPLLNSENNAGTTLVKTFKDLGIKEQMKKEVEQESHNATTRHDEADQPEFGMLDCDYVANTADIEVTNIRLGSNTQSYFVKCYKFFGSYESHWCDEDFFVDILNEIGLPEERHDAYLTHVYKSLVPEQDERENSNYDHLYLTDSDSEEEFDVNKEFGDYSLEGENESITSDQYEGLDDLVSFSKQHEQTRNMEFGTEAVQTVGSGKKKKLVLHGDMDDATKELLQEKYKLRMENKATKIKNKLEFIDEQNKHSTDLLLKYPYGLHIKNIKEEFELFKFDLSRQRLSFPPLDPHGNKTIEKMGKHYNLKINKRTSKSYKYISCEETKRTAKKGPNYQLIDQLLKQRPVFMRIDRKLPAHLSIQGSDDDMSGSARSKFRVKDGEIVGAKSAAIDASNIGHQMLRKLGWKNGEGLGKQGQQGIVEPLQVLVKKSKKGVGHQTNS